MADRLAEGHAAGPAHARTVETMAPVAMNTPSPMLQPVSQEYGPAST